MRAKSNSRVNKCKNTSQEELQTKYVKGTQGENREIKVLVVDVPATKPNKTMLQN